MGDHPGFKHGQYKHRNNATRYRSPSFSMIQTIEADFSRKRNLKRSHNRWSLPPAKTLFKCKVWENKHMMLGKKELNDVKNSLSDFDLKEWHKHTRETNHAGHVVNIVRKKIFPELLTQAWCKFYEIVSSYNLVSDEAAVSGTLNSIHLCEAPGAFITSLNHFLKLRHPDIQWRWRASTLNPYYEGNKLSFMINDDRFILHTIDSWEFGRDQSGNLFEPANIDSLISIAKCLAPVLLVTADGSIDCQSNPGEQESIVSPLHYCETFVALNVLAPGGSFLLKMFTMFESPTICLLYLLSCLFETVDLFKPATSKGGNSEVYVVCLNFYGSSALEGYQDVFKSSFFESNDRVMFGEDQIPMDFLCQISECMDFFKALQISVLNNNIQTYHVVNNEEQSWLFQIKKRLAYSYLERYRLDPLVLPEDFIVGNEIIMQTLTLNLDPRSEESTFSYKASQEQSTAEVFQGYQSLIKNVKPVCYTGSTFETDQLHKGLILSVTQIYGSPIMTVYSSKFSIGSLLHVWNQLYELKKTDLHNTFKSDTFSNNRSEFTEVSDGGSISVCEMWDVPYMENVCLFERECLTRLIDFLKKINKGDHLLLVGLPLLTRVSVGLVFYTAQAFHEVRFDSPSNGYGVLFVGRKQVDICPALEDMLKSMSDKYEDGLALHSFIPINLLIRDSDWYKCILHLNHTYLTLISTKLMRELLSDSSSQNT